MVAANRKRSARSLASSPATQGKEKTTPQLSARVKKAAARSGTATVQATRFLVEDWMDKNPKLIVALWAAVSTGMISEEIAAQNHEEDERFASVETTIETIENNGLRTPSKASAAST